MAAFEEQPGLLRGSVSGGTGEAGAEQRPGRLAEQRGERRLVPAGHGPAMRPPAPTSTAVGTVTSP